MSTSRSPSPPAAKPKALALYGMILALAGAAGPILGGVLIDANPAGPRLGHLVDRRPGRLGPAARRLHPHPGSPLRPGRPAGRPHDVPLPGHHRGPGHRPDPLRVHQLLLRADPASPGRAGLLRAPHRRDLRPLLDRHHPRLRRSRPPRPALRTRSHRHRRRRDHPHPRQPARGRRPLRDRPAHLAARPPASHSPGSPSGSSQERSPTSCSDKSPPAWQARPLG